MALRFQRRRGVIVLAACFSLGLLVLMAGLAVDVGRIYVVKNEAQAYADGAALLAAREWDGTAAGQDRARQAIDRSPNRWDFGTAEFAPADRKVEFAADGAVRVLVEPRVPVTFLAVMGSTEQKVAARAAAARAGGRVRLVE